MTKKKFKSMKKINTFFNNLSNLTFQGWGCSVGEGGGGCLEE